MAELTVATGHGVDVGGTHQGRLDANSPAMDRYAQGRLTRTHPSDFGTPHDPITELETPPEWPAGRPGGVGGDDFVGAPPGFACDEEVDPTLEDLFGDHEPHGSFFEWRLERIDAVQAQLAVQIDELYDRLDVHCQPRSKCDWAPSLLWRRLDDHYGRVRGSLEAQCVRQTGEDFADLGRLFRVAPVSLLSTSDATAVTGFEAATYTSSVTAMHALWPNLEAYNAMVYDGQAEVRRKAARHVFQRHPKDSNNQATFAQRDGVARSRRADGFAVAIRAQQAATSPCDPANADGAAVDQDRAIDFVCECATSILTDAEVEAAIMGVALDVPLFGMFLSAESAGSQYLFVGMDGNEIGAFQDETRVDFELHFNIQYPLTRTFLLGPAPVTVRGGLVGVIGVRVDWEGDAGDICDAQTGGDLVNVRLRAHAGVDIHPTVSTGYPGVMSLGADGWLRLFDLGLEHTTGANLRRRTELTTQETSEFATELATVLNEIGCTPAVVLSTQDIEAGCGDLIKQLCGTGTSTPTFDPVDRIFESRIDTDWRVAIEQLEGGISVFLELLYRRFSIALLRWQAPGRVGTTTFFRNTEEKSLFTAIAGSEDTNRFFNDHARWILHWPFEASGGGDAPFCPSE